MRRIFLSLAVLLVAASATPAAGLLIPTEKQLPPLAMLNHAATIAIEEQVAVTRIEQTFRNHTDRPLEATYIFPVPKGASVRKFSMWVDGKEVPGELVEADKARKIYTDIVQRTLDPGLLEYMGSNLLKLRVFPVPAKGDQKIALSYTSIANSDAGMVEYVYPLKTDGKAASTLEKFSLTVSLKSQHPITNIYSPSHAITTSRPSEKVATVGFEKDGALLDRDFTLYYQAGGKDIGLTALTHRPATDKPGHFLLMMSPRNELSKSQQVPRDMVFVLDTSSSMRGKRIMQAKAAMKYCLSNLTPNDRFAMVHFATTVNTYADQLQTAGTPQVEAAKKWVDALEVTGGTNIDDGLRTALELRTADTSRTFTVVFFTDGRPTIGEINPEKIQQNVAKRNSANTRIFTFGVGDDVNAALLDGIADSSRALSSYVRESEDIETKVGSLYAKISNPVLANLKLTVSGADVKLSEIYPPQLPDLFHGNQLVVLGRYTGDSHAAVKLTGTVGNETKEFVYELSFPAKTAEEKPFVEDLWARRKVGYLLDQIRINGEKKELVEEVVTLAKRHGITTPYTSYLMVPDSVLPVAGPRPGGPGIGGGLPNVRFDGAPPAALAPPGPTTAAGTGGPPAKQQTLAEFAKQINEGDKDVSRLRDKSEGERLTREVADAKGDDRTSVLKRADERREALSALDQARGYFGRGEYRQVQGGKLGVDFATHNNALRNQTQQLCRTAARNVQNRNCIEVGGVWIDEGYNAKMETVAVKAMSKAYFRLLERHPQVRDVLTLGNYVVWVAPNGQALIIDQNAGREEMPDADLDRLFVAAKK